ncbi:MAG: alpha/beta hydrolase, partial [Geminicoccaceae bacterium]
VLLWGSSYSAALALVIAGQQPDSLDAVLAFSPGEHLSGQGVADVASSIEAPVFMTSAASEVDQWSAIFDEVGGAEKTAFKPNQGGVHGSSALISSRNPTAEEY